MSNQKFKGDLEEFSYALGMSVASNLISSGVQELSTPEFVQGIEDMFKSNKTQLTPTEANDILEKYSNKSMEQKAEDNLKKGVAFLTENKKRKDVKTLGSGLQYEVVTQGNGEIPKITDTVKCHYHGTLIDGTVFDSSVNRNQPAEFPVNGVIQGWVEALQLMKTGSKWRLFVPSNLAYGKRGASELIGPNTTLIFDVELLEIL